MSCGWQRLRSFRVPFLVCMFSISGAALAQVSAPVLTGATPNSIPQGSSYQNVTLTGSGFTTSSYHQFSIDGGSTWSWATAAPTYNSSTSLTVAVNNTIVRTVWVRVCSSYGSSVCSNSVTVTVTAAAPVPTVSSVSPTQMPADGVTRPLTIYGSNFQSGNVVQFKWGVGAGAGVWNTGLYNPPTIVSSTQMTINMNPGTVTDTIYVRVCRSATQTTSADCSSGTQSVTVTAAQTLTVTLSANPSSGTAPLNGVSLTATVGGTATGTINYTFYCNRADTGINITSGWAAKFDGVYDNPKTASGACSYSAPGTYTAKVIVERGSAPPTQAQATVTVTAAAPVLTGATPNSIPQGSSYQNVTLTGSGFTTSSYHQFSVDGGSTWSWATAAPTYNSSTSLTVAVNNTIVRTVWVRVCSSYGSSVCSNSVTVTIQAAQTLTVTLNANPSSGTAPLNGVSLTATVGGTATGTINYTFYCNRADTGINITSGWAAKFDGVYDNPKTASGACSYSAPGTYTAKVIVERGSAPPTQAQAKVTVTAAAPVPTVSSVSPTQMPADGVTRPLTIYGSNFQSGNVVQFKWGVGAGAGVWNTGLYNPPTIVSSTQMTISMNPGTVTDTIYVRVCRSATQTTSADCSSGTQSVTVTAAAPVPTVSSVSPTQMPADGVTRPLTIYGSNFQSGNVVQFKWGVGAGAGVWNTGLYNPPTIVSSTQMTINMNPGTVTDTIYVRVCRSATQTTSADCSSGTQSVTVTAAAPVPSLTAYVTTPSSPASGQPFTINLTGNNFDPALAQILFTGLGCSPCVVSNSSLTTKSSTLLIGPATLGSAGTYTVTVRNGASGPVSNGLPLTVGGVTPSLTSFSTSPSPPVAGQPFTLTLNGSNFDPALAQIVIYGTGCGPCVIPNGSLTTKTTTQIAGPVTLTSSGSFDIRAQNGSGGGLSNTLTLVLGTPAPTLTMLGTTPTSPAPGQPFTINLTGNNFDPALAQILFTGPGCSPCVVSNSSLTTKSSTLLIGPATLGSAGTYTVTVRNGASGPVSNGLPLTVGGVTPSLTSFSTSPSPPVAGQPFTLTLNGSNFDPALAQIVIYGTGCGPCVIPNGSLTTKTTTQIAGPVTLTSSGSFDIRAQNGSGGGLSNTLTLVLGTPAPTLTMLGTTPTSPAPGQPFTINLTGNNFDPALAQILFTGPGCSPCVVSNSSLTTKSSTLLIGPATLGSAGTYTVTVRNGSGGLVSNALSLTVNAVVPASPSIQSLSRPSIDQGFSYAEVSIYGSGFTAQSYHQFSIDNGATWDWAVSPPTYDGPTALTIAVANQIPRTVLVRVCASKGNGTACSNSLPITVVPPSAPVLQSYSSSASQGAAFVFAGIGYTPKGAVRRILQGGGNVSRDLGTISADYTGRVDWTWATSCSDAAGSYVARAIDLAANREAQATVSLTASASCSLSPKLEFITGQPLLGNTLVIEGANFTPNGQVRRFVTAPNRATQEIDPAQADGSGRWTWNFVTNCADPAGTWALVALDVGRSLSSNVLSAPLSMNPSCPAQPDLTDRAELVSESGPTSPLSAGSTFVQEWVLRNTGTTSWDSRYRLEYVSGDAGCPRSSVAVKSPVPPGGTYRFSLTCSVPPYNGAISESWQFTGPQGTIPIGQAERLWLRLSVSAPASLVFSQKSVLFTYKAGDEHPPLPAVITLTSSAGNVPYEIQIQPPGVAWLKVDRKGSSTPDTLKLSVKTGLPPGEYSASVRAVSGTSVPAELAIHLKVTEYAPFIGGVPSGQLILLGWLDPARDTIVLTHGLQTENEANWEDKLWTGVQLKQATALLVKRLHGRPVNIVRFLWGGARQGPIGYPAAKAFAPPSGIVLASRLIQGLCPDFSRTGVCTYNRRIHFIGHSLGTIVNAHAAKAFLEVANQIAQAQFTTLDMPQNLVSLLPDAYTGYSSEFLASILPLDKLRGRLILENYFSRSGLTGVGDFVTGAHYNVELNDPDRLDAIFLEGGLSGFSAHSGVHQWYRWTIWPKLPIDSFSAKDDVCPDWQKAVYNWFDPKTEEDLIAVQHITNNHSLNPCQYGFNTSIILDDHTDATSSNDKQGGRLTNEFSWMPLYAGTSLSTSPSYANCAVQTRLATGAPVGGMRSVIESISCRGDQSAYSALPIYIPPGATAISFKVTVDSPAEGDRAVVAVDNQPIWVLDSGSILPGFEFEAGPIPVDNLTGQRVLTVSLVKEGNQNNVAFQLKDFQVQVRTVATIPAMLSASVVRPDSLQAGQQGAQMQIVVTNARDAGPTAGEVSVDLLLPAGLDLVSASGAGWNCVRNRCVRSDSLAAGFNYPPIVVVANVSSSVASPAVVLVSTSGGGSAGSMTRESIPVAGASGGSYGNSADDAFVPLVLPQLAYGGGWQTALYFYNSNPSAVSFPLNFISRTGGPLEVPLAGLGPTSSRILTLGAGSTTVLVAPNVGELVQGWVETALPSGVNAYAVFRQSVPGRPDQEAVVLFEPRSSRTADFAFDDERQITAVSIVNPALQSATVKASAYGADNRLLGSADLPIGPRSKLESALRELPGLGRVAGRIGRVRIESDKDSIAVLGLRFGGEAVTTIPVAQSGGTQTPSGRFVLPQVAFGGGWTTEMYFTNTSNTVANVPVNFFSDRGTALSVPMQGSQSSSYNMTLRAGETMRLTVSGTESLTQGWAEASLPPGVIGYAVFRQTVPGRADQEAVVPLTRADGREAQFAFDDAGLTTTVALLNPAYSAVWIAVTAYGEDGQLLAATQLNLPALSKQAYILRNLPGLSMLTGKRGRIKIQVMSLGTISALGFRFGGEAFTSIPVQHR
ncbi:MAG: hypothetical protein KatS3mg004_3372 [Bryobacteraceae bacterium]|nr:MAG: hypothetical protein KatS3mg004_3372 [Bryobacteraceae bacterium]